MVPTGVHFFKNSLWDGINLTASQSRIRLVSPFPHHDTVLTGMILCGQSQHELTSTMVLSRSENIASFWSSLTSGSSNLTPTSLQRTWPLGVWWRWEWHVFHLWLSSSLMLISSVVSFCIGHSWLLLLLPLLLQHTHFSDEVWELHYSLCMKIWI